MAEAGRHSPPFVAGIGASAGGLEALVELLGALPTTGMAFIVVQHLAPRHESLLPEILAKHTTMAVSLATAGQAVQPDHVYVIPPDGLLTVHEGLIEVKPRPSGPERSFPVDLLFSSLAVAYGEGAIGVVLSGGDADGSLGLRAIKEAGGFTFAQQPDSALPDDAHARDRDGLCGSRAAPDGDCRRACASQPALPHGGAECRVHVGEHEGHWHRRTCGPRVHLPEASLGARRRLHPLQTNHDQAPSRAADDAATERESGRVPRGARSRSGRARRPVPGLPDRGHRVLP